MTCEDYECDDDSVLVKGARRLALLLTSPPIRRGVELLPKSLKAALATVLSASAKALNS